MALEEYIKSLRDTTPKKKKARKNKKTQKKRETSKKKHTPEDENFERETDLEAIEAYLHQQSTSGKPLELYYRDDTSPRIFYDYIIDGEYLRVNLGGRDYTFRIDKIRKIKK